jgi:GDP-L-fucose synthase
MRILVTGSNGCVGKALKTQCIDSNFRCMDDNDWIFIERKDCDLTDREQTIQLFKDIRPEYLVHLASYVPGFYNIDRVASFSSNVRINENVLEAAHLARVEKGIFCLSVNMFSETISKFPMNESAMLDGSLSGNFSGYAYSKRMLALQCQNYNEQYGRKYFGIIPCNIYGPHDNSYSGRLIPNLICRFKKAIKDNSDVIINGSGKPLRQFIYSIDLAKIIKQLVVSYNDVKPIICCNDSEISVFNLAYEISKIMNFKNNIIFDTSKPDGNLRKTVDNSYLKTIMPQFSFTSLESGLRETINHMEGI